MSLSAEKKSRPDFLKTVLPLFGCAVILAAGIGAAADEHLLYDKGCVLCLLSLFTPAVETCAPDIPGLNAIRTVVHPENALPFLDPLAAATASRSPPPLF
ncbi:MAG TPA: hypothetical protein VLL97_13720 [Acidobacteriota bacterium]|nr:hypothetical protein [Acidobacteriota bacterium]